MTLNEALAVFTTNPTDFSRPTKILGAAYVLAAEVARLRGVVEKGLDYEHQSSCGHVWTMRHTACPECFAQMKAENAKLRDEVRRLRAYAARCPPRRAGGRP